MPQVGEKRLGRDIGKQHAGQKSRFYMWTLCIDCGKGKWTYLRNGQPDSPRCNSCANRKNNLGRTYEKANKWNGGVCNHDGYIDVALKPDHPYYCMCTSNGYVRLHRLIMAQHLNRPLLPFEVVHHLNGNKSDNRLANLKLLPAADDHLCFLLAQRHIAKLERQIEQLKENMRSILEDMVESQ